MNTGALLIKEIKPALEWDEAAEMRLPKRTA